MGILFGDSDPNSPAVQQQGLLAQYYTPAMRQQALYQGLLGLGGSLIAAGAPSHDPGYAARSILAGTSQFGHALDAARQNAMQQAALSEKMAIERLKLNEPKTEAGKLLAEVNRLPPNDPNRRFFMTQLAKLGQDNGFALGMDANGNTTMTPIAGGPADIAGYVAPKAGAVAAAEAPFKMVPVPPGGGVFTGREFFGGGASPPPAAPRAALPTGPIPSRAPVGPGTPLVEDPRVVAGPSPQLYSRGAPAPLPPAASGIPDMGEPSSSQDATRQVARTPAGSVLPMDAYALERNKEEAKTHVEQARAAEDAAVKASAQIEQYRRFQAYQEAFRTGKLAGARVTGAALLQEFGLDPKALGLADAGPGQALEAISNKLVQGNIGGAGGFPANSFSNTDRDFLVASEPSLTKTPEGNKLLIEGNIAMAERVGQKAEAWRQFRSKGGDWREFESRWKKYADANPVFGDEFRARVKAATTAPQTDERGTARREVPPAPVVPPQAAIEFFRRNRLTPGIKEQFEAEYGPGAIQKYVDGQGNRIFIPPGPGLGGVVAP